jgi:transposase
MSSRGRAPSMTDEELLEMLQSTDEWADRPFTSAPEIAEQSDVEYTRQAVHERLQKLVKQVDSVRKYKPGRSAIYWVEDSENA